MLEAPAITLVPPATWSAVDRALGRISDYRYLIFTSVNGVNRFFARLRTRKIDVRQLKGSTIVAIGPATAAAIEERGLRVAAVPEEYCAEGVVKILGRRSLRGARVLIPRAAVARDLLIRALTARGACVDTIPVYRSLPTRQGVREVQAALRAGSIDLLTFTSSSTVSHFVARFRSRGDRRRLLAIPAAVIGPITAATAKRHRLRVRIMPREYTVPALADAIVRKLRRGGASPRVLRRRS